MKQPKLNKGAKITLTFKLGQPQHLTTMLYNMSSRSVVDGRILCTIDEVVQDWWEESENKREEYIERRRVRDALEQDERKRKVAAITAAITRDPNRSDEEIAAALGLHPYSGPSDVKWYRNRQQVARIQPLFAPRLTEP